MKDHDRPLNPRGRRDAVAVGELLVAQGLAPDAVACSTAVRARQTWDGAIAGGARSGEVQYLDEIYAASVPALLAVVQKLPEVATTVLLIGHAPGVPDLVGFLAAREPGSPAWARLDQGYPTAGVAVLTLPGPWAKAGEDCADFASFHVPRG